MPAAWTIQGESGKAWNETVQTFEFRKIENAQFTFQNLGEDAFTFRISAQNIATESLPDYTQKIVVYRNGARFFTGHVTNRQVSIDSGQQVCTVKVSGPWWWMDRITFTATNTDATGATAERATLAFGGNTGQNLKTSIETAINRCVDLGVPIAKTTDATNPSSVATMANFPRITLNQSTCSQVLSELIRFCADAMVYFDYSTITPSLKVTRRRSGLAVGSAPSVTLNASTDPITSIDLNPMIEMEVQKVDLPYLDRNTEGRYRYQQQSFGTASSPLPKLQIITISGPELDTFLPIDLFDYFVCTTDDTLRNAVANASPQISAFWSTHGFNPIGSTWPNSISKTFVSYWLNGQGGTISSYQVPSGTVSRTGKYIRTIGLNTEIPEWAKLQYNITEELVKGGLWGQMNPYPYTQYSQLGNDFHAIFGQTWWSTGSGSSTTVYAGQLISSPIRINVAPSATTLKTQTSGVVSSAVSGTSFVLDANAASIDDVYVNASIEYTYRLGGSNRITTGYIVAYNGSTRTVTISGSSGGNAIAGTAYKIYAGVNYRKEDYAFISPPSGLAQFLKECQDYVPYEGSMTLVQEDIGSTRFTGSTISISNSLSEYSGMRALVKSETLTVENGQTTISLGQADRLDYRTLVDRMRKTSQDNIYYVT